MKKYSSDMSALDNLTLNRASAAWAQACSKLGVRIVAPFKLDEGGSSITLLAFLPDFGGKNGMFIAGMALPHITPDAELIKLASARGVYISFINAKAFGGQEVAERVFKEALTDWGYYGASSSRPVWLA